MLQNVDVGRRSLHSYRGCVPEEILAQLETEADELKGARVLHLNATPYGGGVSELLRSSVPLLRDLGIEAEWHVISGSHDFFRVTKAIHNGLQGAAPQLSDDDQEMYLHTAERNAHLLGDEQYDFVFIHDPQPAALLDYRDKGSAQWVWRCHIDTSSPNAQVWKLFRPHLRNYDAAIFTMHDFVPPDLPIERVEVISPAIDPLSPKNLPLAASTTRRILDWIGIELNRPLITQVSRFDPWKDPFGVIEAYRLVRQQVPDLQLALVGSMALDDPEAWEIHRQLSAESRHDPLLHVFSNLSGVGNIEVNAFQQHSDVVVQKSLREGFGLVVSETLWKGTPVVAGRAGGIPLQMADGIGGELVDDVESCARALTELLGDSERAGALGAAGRERVRRQFLLPRLLLDEVRLMLSLRHETTLAHEAERGQPRDPVCGMTIAHNGKITLTHDGHRFSFCSERCREQFRRHPKRYMSASVQAGTPTGKSERR